MDATLANIAELVGGKIVAGDPQLKILGFPAWPKPVRAIFPSSPMNAMRIT